MAVVVLVLSAVAQADETAQRFQEGVNALFAGDAAKARLQLQPPLYSALPDFQLYFLAKAQLVDGQSAQSAATVQKLLQDYPKSPWVAATQKWGKVQRPDDRAQGDTLESLAMAEFKARNYAVAATLLEKVRRQREDTELLTTLASAYARSNQFDKAIQIQEILSRGKNSLPLYKIVFLQMDRHAYSQAISAADRYLAQYPNGAEVKRVLWIQAWSYFRLKSYDKAVSAFQTYSNAVQSSEERNRAYYWIGRSLKLSGKTDTALHVWDNIPNGYYGMLVAEQLGRRKLIWTLKPPGKGRLGGPAQTVLDLGFPQWVPLVAEKSMGVQTLIHDVAPYWGLTPALVTSIINTESQFRSQARSPAGAMGLMQLIPSTAIKVADAVHWDGFQETQLFDPLWNVTLGMAYLQQLAQEFDLPRLIASYNAGEEAVRRWVTLSGKVEQDIFIDEIPYDETRQYVKKVLMGIW